MLPVHLITTKVSTHQYMLINLLTLAAKRGRRVTVVIWRFSVLLQLYDMTSTLCYYLRNWSDRLRQIIKCCYEHYSLDPERYIYEDPEDKRDDRSNSVLPEELRPQSPSPSSPAARLLPDPRHRRRLRANESDEDDGEDLSASAPIPQSKRPRVYDPFSQEPTPLALRRPRRK